VIGLGGGRPLFTFDLAGFPVAVQPLFLAVLAMAGLASRSLERGLTWAAVVAASVLWHELGHALAMRRFGYAAEIELVAMGGLTHWPDDADPTPHERLRVSAAGPLAGLALGGLSWALARAAGPLPPLASLVVRDLLWVNVFWSLFNLLPLIPLDGSHVLEALHGLRPRLVRASWVGWASALSGAAVVLWAVSRQSVWIGFLGGVGLVQGLERLKRGGGFRRAAAPDALALARVGRLPPPALADLVRSLVDAGRHAELAALAQERLSTFDRREDAEPLARLATEALAEAGLHGAALDVAAAAFRQLRAGAFAYEAALLAVELDRHADAVAWLERALDAGLECRGVMAEDPGLAPLRRRADFRALLS